MTTIPQSLNLDRYIGDQFQQIRIGKYDLQLRFSSDLQIGCEGTVRIENKGIEKEIFRRDGLRDCNPITEVVGEFIDSWTVETPYVLAIALSGGNVLRFISENSQFEDFCMSPESLAW